MSLSNSTHPAILFHLSCLRIREEADPQKLLEDPVIADIAKKHRRSSAQVSIMSVLYNPCLMCCTSTVGNSDVLPGVAEVPCAAGYCCHP